MRGIKCGGEREEGREEGGEGARQCKAKGVGS